MTQNVGGQGKRRSNRGNVTDKMSVMIKMLTYETEAQEECRSLRSEIKDEIRDKPRSKTRSVIEEEEDIMSTK
jgi:hypothetical protein